MSRARTTVTIWSGVFAAAAVSTLANAEVRFTQAGPHKIAYEVMCEGDPIVLIPGFSQSRKAWKLSGHAQALCSSGRQVILIDPRGHGGSDKPHDWRAYSFDAVDDDVIAVLDDLQVERADLIGYSRGGWIAVAVAIQHPQRVRAVFAGGSHPYGENMRPFRQAVAKGLDDWIRMIEERAGPIPPAARSMFMANDIVALRAAVSHDRSDQSKAVTAADVPLFLYAGSEDPRAKLAREYASKTPAAKFLELKGLNHFQAFFAVDPVVALVNGELADETVR